MRSQVDRAMEFAAKATRALDLLEGDMWPCELADEINQAHSAVRRLHEAACKLHEDACAANPLPDGKD